MDPGTDSLPSKVTNSKELFETITIPNFLRKTYDILQSNEFSDLICWSDDGHAVVIKQPSEFANQVLPKYFKHSNLSSYIRQLNMYNFRKKKTSSLECFVHDDFQKDRMDLLSKIKRKKSESFASAKLSPQDNKPLKTLKCDSINESNKLLEENMLLKKLQLDITQRFMETERKVLELTNHNQILRIHLQNLILRSSLPPPINLSTHIEPQSQHKIEFDPIASFQSSNSQPQMTYSHPSQSESTQSQGVYGNSWPLQLPKPLGHSTILFPSAFNSY